MGILVAERKFFGEIGSLDGGMKIYGGENVELGIRVRFSGCCMVIDNYLVSQQVSIPMIASKLKLSDSEAFL